MGAQQPALGWPFLVARGRQHGYAVLLAPDFLVDGQEYGFLEEVAGPTRQGSPVRITSATTPSGRPVCLTWTEYEVTRADLSDSGPTVDEHSRPLRLTHGFLCPATRMVDVAAADLDHAHHVALDAYQRFLADEHGFRVARSVAFEIGSTVAGPARPSAEQVRPLAFVSRPVAGLAVAVVLLVLAVLLGIQLFSPATRSPVPVRHSRAPSTCVLTTSPVERSVPTC
jgi:hypothetical protein